MKVANDILERTMTFQSYLFDYRKGSIIDKDWLEIFMEPRLKELFHFLLINKNDFIEREKLLSFVWKDIIVSEQSVTKAISDLRKFFITIKIENVKIVTISKQDYKLEIHENPKRSLIKQILMFLAYTFGLLLALIIIFRALQYNQ